ncbi:MAG: hypothetical protein FWD96_04470 [Defluviitaleaceae bacterium]|nr:hypothetical protein [Defluviitaleaceae bacterium]
MQNFLSKPVNFIIPLAVAFFNVLLILFPGDIVEAARGGLLLWFNNVLPALLPFIIGTNILASVGFVGFLGKLLDPVMLALFRLPGAGGFALVTGMMSGYPMGAKTAATLAQNGQINAAQAWRLAALCNNSGPLFVLGAVGAGLLRNIGVGYFILICHYIGALTVGFVLARFVRREPLPARFPVRTDSKGTPAYSGKPSKRPRLFGEILGASVKGAMDTIVVVGGYIILFAVIVRILDILGTFDVAQMLAQPFLAALGIEPALLTGILVGIIEMTNGTLRLSEPEISAQTVAALTFVVSFGGFSIHAQSASFLARAGVRSGGYIVGKLLHGITSATLSYFAFGLLDIYAHEAAPTFFQTSAPLLRVYATSSALFLASVGGFIAFAAICRLFVRKRKR